MERIAGFRLCIVCLSVSAAAVLGQIRVACIGNSITQGSGHGYVEKLDTLLGNGYTVQNDGASGTTLLRKGDTPYWLSGKFKELLPFSPHMVTIKFGTNDSKPGNWRYGSEFTANLNSLIDTLYTIAPRPQIWLCLPTPVWANQIGASNDTIEKAIIPKIQAVAAQRNLPIIDLHTPFVNHPGLFPDGVHPGAAGCDSLAHIMYRRFVERPIMQLSDTMLTFLYEFSRTGDPPPQVVTFDNLCPSRPPAPVTVSGLAAWLTIGISEGAPGQLTNVVSVAALPRTEEKYYDTITVQAPAALVPDVKYTVMLWMRPPSVFSAISFAVTTVRLTPGETTVLAARALNQYGELLAPQPALSWSATGGSVSNGGVYTAPQSLGNYQVVASFGGKSVTCRISVSRFNVLPDSGYATRILLLEKDGCPFFNSLGANINYDYLGNERTIKPWPGDTSRPFNQTWIWTAAEKANGMWLSDSARTYFVAYGMLYLYTPIARQAFLHYRHGDDFAVFVNGALFVKALGGDREAEADTAVSLNPGITAFLLKIADKGGYPYFGVRFADDQGRNIEGLNYLLQPDTLTAGIGTALRAHPDRRFAGGINASRTALRVALSGRGPYTLTIVSIAGRTAIVRNGKAPAIHCFSRRTLVPGAYMVCVSGGGSVMRRIIMLGP